MSRNSPMRVDSGNGTEGRPVVWFASLVSHLPGPGEAASSQQVAPRANADSRSYRSGCPYPSNRPFAVARMACVFPCPT